MQSNSYLVNNLISKAKNYITSVKKRQKIEITNILLWNEPLLFIVIYLILNEIFNSLIKNWWHK